MPMKIAEPARRVGRVASRPNWAVVLVVVMLFAFSGGSATDAFTLIVLPLVLAITLLALDVLDRPLFSLRSLIPGLSPAPTPTRLVLAFLLLVVAVAILYAMRVITYLTERIVDVTGGDPDLTTCALVCALALVFCTGMSGFRRWQTRRLEQGDPPTSEVERTVIVRASLEYWTAAAGILAVAFVALIPAALLTNWAFNVLGSVLLPLLVLSVKRAGASEPPYPPDAERSP